LIAKYFGRIEKPEGKRIAIPYLAENKRDMGHSSFVRERKTNRAFTSYTTHWGLLLANNQRAKMVISAV
jgi:hypothetical protein